MIRINADVAFLILGIIVVWGYSRWLVATEHRKYRRPRLWLDNRTIDKRAHRNGR
jgi:hypothetical protein